jgi:hypothetical protein
VLLDLAVGFLGETCQSRDDQGTIGFPINLGCSAEFLSSVLVTGATVASDFLGSREARGLRVVGYVMLGKRGASMSLLNVNLVLHGLPSPGIPRDAEEGECLSEIGERFSGESFLLAGVASRSKRLIRDARSFVAASRTDMTPIAGNQRRCSLQ